jgi:NhaP-type Na+/H+ or K+/H+ antiporter
VLPEQLAAVSDPFAGLPLAALSQSRTLFELGLIVVLAAAAPLLAQVLRLPSILLLLALGFGAGAAGALDPNALLGQNLISTLVSIAVGIILFDAGLGLNFRKLSGNVARVYRRLVSIGILVTWAVGTVAAYLLFDLSWEIALVLGAVLVVSGPTVVGPLLEFIRPSKTVNDVLKWEGTFADPIGATLGVVVFSAVIAGHATAGQEIAHFALNVGVGLGFGILGGVLVLTWARWFKPNQSQAFTGTLMFVVAMVVSADLLRDDTGLITGLVIGAILVNRPPGGTERVGMAIQRAKLRRGWRERIATLSTFLIGILFIVLSARVTPHQVAEIGWISLAFVAVLVFIGRPLAVGLSTLGSSLPMRERAFIAWMAPRGIVAAATSSTFALGLASAGVGGGAENLIPITFIVIVATALIYGLSGGPVARALGVATTGPGGILLVGASPVGRAVGHALQERGLTVLVWTGDDAYAKVAKADGLSVYAGNPTEDASGDAPSQLDELDYALAVAEDEALNAMVATDLSEYFGRDHVFQLAGKDKRTADFYTRTRVLFDDSASHEELLAQIKAGGKITVTEAPANGKKGSGNGDNGAADLPMFVLTPGKDLQVLAAGDHPTLGIGQELIGLVKGRQHGS